MLSKEKLARIGALSQISRERELTPEEKMEQQNLRQEYLNAFRGGMKNHIEGLKFVDPNGNDVTPEKLKAIQKEKGLHGR